MMTKQDSFSAIETGFSCDCSGRSLWPPGTRPAGGRKRYTTKRVLTLVNAMQCTVLPHITASVFINDDAGPGAGFTTAPARLASGKPLSCTKGQAAEAHLKRHGPRGGGGGDGRAAPLRHVGADLFRPGGRAGPRVLTAGGGSGCWSKSSASRCARSYLGSHGVWRAKATVAGQPGSGERDESSQQGERRHRPHWCAA
jgi:hypothetical protein